MTAISPTTNATGGVEAAGAPPGKPKLSKAFVALFAPLGAKDADGETERQDVAVPGKDVPDEDGKTLPIDIVWMTSPELRAQLAPAAGGAVSTPQSIAGTTIVAPPPPVDANALLASAAPTAAIEQPAGQSLVQPTEEIAALIAAAKVSGTVASTSNTTRKAPPMIAGDATPDRSMRQETLPVSADAPAAYTTYTPIVAQAAIAPAARVFADAIHRAVAADDTQPTPQATAIVPAGTDATIHAVTAAGDARHAALDMRHDDWPQAMIDRIDALRDAANANDASIRLIPDALGKIDVSLTRDGDAVNVRFAAHQAETRQILADAQPRLTELAEARGLKLSTGAGDANAQPQSQPQQRPANFTAAPPSATESAEPVIADDGRIA